MKKLRLNVLKLNKISASFCLFYYLCVLISNDVMTRVKYIELENHMCFKSTIQRIVFEIAL